MHGDDDDRDISLALNGGSQTIAVFSKSKTNLSYYTLEKYFGNMSPSRLYIRDFASDFQEFSFHDMQSFFNFISQFVTSDIPI